MVIVEVDVGCELSWGGLRVEALAADDNPLAHVIFGPPPRS